MRGLFIRGVFALLLATGTAQAAQVTFLSPQETLPAPVVLSKADTLLYQKIFNLQQDGKWRQADALIKKLDDRLLMGHVLFQRYMHPTKYRSRYSELSKWLNAYADHPAARRIYKLALRRKPAKVQRPVRPKGIVVPTNLRKPREKRAKARRDTTLQHIQLSTSARRIKYRVGRMVQRGYVTKALKYMSSRSRKAKLGVEGQAQTLGLITRGYFRYHLDDKAVTIARKAVKLSPAAAGEALWWGGLAAWRAGNYVQAAEKFTLLGDHAHSSESLQAAAYYWAARSWLAGGEPQRVNAALRQASSAPRTFYGLLAQRSLGLKATFDWRGFAPRSSDKKTVLNIPAVRRAFALAQVERIDLAGAELRPFAGRLKPRYEATLLAMADSAGVADAVHRLGSTLERNLNQRLDAALYPVPNWQPVDGFQLDRALVYAFARQESLFRPRAKSRAGARGLMQLMPSTAAFMAGRSFHGVRSEHLYDVDYNLHLGQKYLRYLLDSQTTDGGNLFLMAAAYNGGPGNLKKWMGKIEFRDDPLLFMESLPSAETRNYVKNVVRNLWMYRHRLGQGIPSLDALLAGHWPIYVAQDPVGTLARAND